MTDDVPGDETEVEGGPITVGDLLDALADQPRDKILIMSSDGEGNSHSPLAEIGEGLYLADNSWSGETYVPHSEIGHGGYTEEDRAPEGAIEVITLWPTN